MQIGPFTFGRTKDVQLAIAKELVLARKALPSLRGLSPSASGWWPWGVIRESFTGAWQANVELRADTALSYYAVYSCTRLITTDIGKLGLRLVEEDADGIWTPTQSPSFSPVLRKPNRYQTINKFIESWILSKLLNGNTYVLLKRDNRSVVTEMHVLDPQRVKPLVAQDGAIFYEINRDDLSGQSKESVILPASEIIHDTYITPFHPLIGLSPIFACALSISEGLNILTNSKNFFANGANPSGMLTAPGAISDETAQRLLTTMANKNAGDTLVGGDGLEYKQFTMSATDAQLIEQLKMSAEQVCSAFGVPPYLVDIGEPPPYANFEPILLKYHSQCIQSLTTNLEKSLDVGLGLVEKVEGRQLGTEFDIDDLIWMDTATRVESAQKAISSGGMSPNEARKKYHGLGKTAGGETPYMQEQNWPLRLLSQRELPAKAPTAPEPIPVSADESDDEMDMAATFAAIRRKALAEGLYAA
jgi:HK97 family phage portal protein